jgi:hypothetical protein
MGRHTRRQRHNLPGTQHLWGFDNSHLASVVPDAEDNNRWELAVLDGTSRTDSTTPIVPGAIGSLKPNDGRRILRQVQVLPRPARSCLMAAAAAANGSLRTLADLAHQRVTARERHR